MAPRWTVYTHHPYREPGRTRVEETERQLWVDIALSLRGGSVADGAAHVALVHTGGRAARPAAMASAAAKSTHALRAGPRGHTLALAVRGRSAMLGRSGVKPMAAASSDTFE